jgi:oligo-1,6-glucosidase
VSQLAPDWWKSAVVYQIYPRSFADANGDGIGDLQGIIDRLDHVAGLGVDVVWLSPIYPSPQADNGYDVSDYLGIDPIYGTIEDFQRLLREVHTLGMKLVMDLVFNHTSDAHPWFVASRSGRDDPKRDWYWWRPPRDGKAPGSPGAEPTNWGAAFSGPAWTLDPRTGEYYLGVFSPRQPDLNWENPQVRHALYEVMRIWLDRGVDGFRLDVINHVSKDPRLPDGEPTVLGGSGDGSPWFVAGPRIHEFMQEMHREVVAPRRDPVLLIGEMPGCTVDEAARFTDPDRHELDMVFTFEHVQIDHGATKWQPGTFDLRDLKASLGRWQTTLAQRGWNSLYLNNHDQPRAVSRFGDEGRYRVRSAKMLATVLHLHRGTPFVYQGEELGMPNAPLTRVEDLVDVESRNQVARELAEGADPDEVVARVGRFARDNARTPMQWDDSQHADFSSTEPWYPVLVEHETINARHARADPGSVYHHYRRLIELRHTEATVVHGDFTMLLPEDPDVYAYTRRLRDVELLVLGNFTGETVAVDLPQLAAWSDAELLIDNLDVPDAATREPDRLRPWEARVLRRRRTPE